LLTLEGVSHRVLMSSHVLEHLVLVATSEGLAHLLLSSESILHGVHSWVIRLKSACQHISSHTCSQILIRTLILPLDVVLTSAIIL
jgi:hypothetical protein